MSILVLNPNTSTHVRVNNDIIYIDFDERCVKQYDIENETYYTVALTHSEGSVGWYNVNALTFSGQVIVDYMTHNVTIKPYGDVRYFEYEEDDAYAVI